MADTKVRPRALVGLDRKDLYKIFAENKFTKGCEVGVMKGLNALAMFESIPNLELILVDPYMQYEYRKFRRRNRWKWHQPTMDKVRVGAVRLLSKKNVIWIMTTSVLAAPCIKDESLDFVYIDGNHAYDFITQDLQLWYPKIKDGGMFSGHDYGIRSVQQAVDLFAKHHSMIVRYTDPKREKRNGSRSKITVSWLMEKP